MAALVLAACVLGSAINIPVARFRDNAVQVEPFASVFGITYLVPVLRSRSTVVTPREPGPRASSIPAD